MSGQRASFAHASSSDIVLRIEGSIVLSATGAATDQLRLTTVTVQRACTKRVASRRPARMCYNGYGENRIALLGARPVTQPARFSRPVATRVVVVVVAAVAVIARVAVVVVVVVQVVALAVLLLVLALVVKLVLVSVAVVVLVVVLVVVVVVVVVVIAVVVSQNSSCR